nr:MAG TPA: hypothetical protein [Caudoviricetes sp.]
MRKFSRITHLRECAYVYFQNNIIIPFRQAPRKRCYFYTQKEV